MRENSKLRITCYGNPSSENWDLISADLDKQITILSVISADGTPRKRKRCFVERKKKNQCKMYKNKITIEEHKFMDLSRHVCDILTSSQKIFFNRRSLFFFNKLMTKFFGKS